MSVTQKPLPGADFKHFSAVFYPLDWDRDMRFLIATRNDNGDCNVLVGSEIVGYHCLRNPFRVLREVIQIAPFPLEEGGACSSPLQGVVRRGRGLFRNKRQQ